MNLAEAMVVVRRDWLDDELGSGETDGYVDDDRLIRFLAEAEDEACRRKDLLFDDTTVADDSSVPISEITIVADTRAYSFSQKITRIERVMYEDVDGNLTTLTQIGGDELEAQFPTWRVDKGIPCRYLIRGRKIYPLPIPSTNEDANKLKLEVYRTPVTKVADPVGPPIDTFEIDEEWHEGLTYWPAHRAFMDRDEDLEDPAGQKFFYQKFEEIFGPPLSAATRRNILEEPRDTNFSVEGYNYQGRY